MLLYTLDMTVAELLFSLAQNLYLSLSFAELQMTHAQPQHCLHTPPLDGMEAMKCLQDFDVFADRSISKTPIH
jgi:hypothetical protein